MEYLNHIPVKDEKITVENLEITVSEVNAHRVSFITVRQFEREDVEEQDS